MPQLLRNIDQDWQIVEDGVTHWHAEETGRQDNPFRLAWTANPIRRLKASAIAVNFPALTDGRGLSLAVLLRAAALLETWWRVATSTGTSFTFVRSGFNVIELPERLANSADLG